MSATFLFSFSALCLCAFVPFPFFRLIFASPVAMVLLLANSGMILVGYLTGLGL